MPKSDRLLGIELVVEALSVTSRLPSPRVGLRWAPLPNQQKENHYAYTRLIGAD